MPRPRTVSDAAILDAARKLFLRDGHTTSTREIARAAGISQAVLYQRFRSKEQLFFRAMLPPPPDLDDLLAPLDRGAIDPALRAVCHALVRHFGALMPDLLHLTTHPAFDFTRLGEAHRHVLALELHARLTARLTARQATGDLGPFEPAAAAQALIAIAHTVALHTVIAHATFERPGEDAVDAMLDVLWNGLRPRP